MQCRKHVGEKLLAHLTAAARCIAARALAMRPVLILERDAVRTWADMVGCCWRGDCPSSQRQSD